MKRSKLDLSMLRMITRNEEIFDRILNNSTFRYYFQRIVIKADYYDIFIIHVLRHVLANVVDNKFFFFICSSFLCSFF